MTNQYHGQSINMLTIQPHTAASNMMAKWFQEETGASVGVVPVPYADITENATRDVTAGAGKYDVIQYWYPMLGSLAEASVLTDITGWWDQNADEFKPADFVPAFRDIWCVSGGRRYGVPYDGDMHLLFYNKVLFRKYGVQPPKTWDEYLAVACSITEGEKGNAYGCGIMGAKIPLILIGTFLNRLAGFGGDFLDSDGNPTINTPEAIAALDHLVAEMPFALPAPTQVAFDEMLGPWLSGRVGMVEFWADLGKMTDNPKPSKIPHEWGVAPLPKGPGPKGKVTAPLNAGWSLGVSAKSRNPELALEFLKFTLRPEIHLRVCTMDGGLDPVRWSTYDLPEYRKYVTDDLAVAAKAAVMSAAVPWPTIARWAELQGFLNEDLALALAGSKTPKQALDDTQAVWNRLLV